MKAAKLIVCCLMTALICLFALPRTQAEAATAKYARADVRDAYFCSQKDLNYALFAIPYTYCVEILSSDDDWYYVKYAEDSGIYRALYGYCLKEGLTPVEVPPENVYLNMPVTVTFKADYPAGTLPVLGELNVTAAFYGTYYSGASEYSYVLYDDSFGYVYGIDDDYPLNEIPSADTADTSQKQPSGKNTKLIIALVLTGLAVAALVILYFTGRKKYFRTDGR